MFGTPSSTPFGSSSGGFGQTNTAPAFGAPAPAPFGAPAPAPGGFGGFGAPAPAPAFGGGGGFGAPAAAPTSGFGGFGSPAPAPSAFGGSAFGAAPATSSPFGAPAPATGTLFGGAPAPATGGLFGGAAPAPAFGSTTSTFGGGGFGSTSATTPAFGGGSTFGTPAPAPTGLFGAPAPAPATGAFGGGGFGATTSAFGSPAPAPTGTLFGGGAPAPAGGMFGAAPAAPGGGGTKIQPYQVTNRQDGTSNINLQAITAMPAYQAKSFEELRLEDYSQGNKGGAAPGAPAGSFGAFGAAAPAPTTGLFGASPAPAPFGAPAPAPGGFGGFGSPAPAPFGAPAPAPFGAPAPAPFGAPAPAPFGSPAPAPGAFGSTAFGAKPPGTGLFGASPAPAPGGGLFGAPAPAPGLFGAPAPAPGAFGAPAPAPSLFGAPAPAPFGAPAPAPFGAPAPAPFGAFGAPAPAPGGSLFGAPAPAPTAFGAPPGGSLFGAPAPAAGGLFGAPKPAAGGGLFGAPAPTTPTAFGAPAPAGGLFGAPAQPAAMPAAPAVGSVMPPAADEILASQLTALENKRKELEKSDNFRRTSKDSSLVIGATLSEREGLMPMAPVRASYSPYRASPKSTARVRPRGFASPDKSPLPSLSRLGAGGRPMAAPDAIAASTATRLIINPSPKPKLKLALQPEKAKTPLKIALPSNGVSTPQSIGIPPKESNTRTPSSEVTPRGVETPQTAERGLDYYHRVAGSPVAAASPPPSSAAPTLTKDGYKCSPTIEELRKMPDADLAAVPKFTVECVGVGSIEWEGAVDVRNANLDEVVLIEDKSVSVYIKEEAAGTKPTVGTKLNRPALITLQGVYPPDGNAETQAKFARKVERQTKRMEAQLIDYDPTTGVWKLRVQHFSRYALDEDDSESESEPMETTHFQLGEREGRSPVAAGGDLRQRQATPFKPRMVPKDDEEMELMSEEEVPAGESKLVQDAESAFAAMQTIVKEQTSTRKARREETAAFVEEGEERSMNEVTSSRYIPTADDLLQASASKSICGSIGRASGMKLSSIDFGRRMGRSFRVGWSPDGSYFRVGADGKLKRGRPVFAALGNPTTETKTLEKHKANAIKAGEDSGGCPTFALPGPESGLVNTLIEYSRQDMFGSNSSMDKEAFALLKCLISSSSMPDSVQESRRLFAVQQWLMKSCSNEVAGEIRDAKLRNDKYEALLAAVSGCNVEEACAVASELGLHQLSTLLVAGPEGRADVLSEVTKWVESGVASNLPDALLRSYNLLGGRFDMEETRLKQSRSQYDWRRWLAMRLSYSLSDGLSDLAGLISEYESKISLGSAPFPKPAYAQSRSGDSLKCVRYRLLGLARDGQAVPLKQIVDPSGYTSTPHDFSLAFHLAATISAMGYESPLSDADSESLIEGYAAQLLSAGQWHWAVYVYLCQFGRGGTKLLSWKLDRAKSVVLRCYKEKAHEERNFLQDLGVPSVWFEEALALQCSTQGDEVGYLEHMVRVNPDDARTFLESTFIPKMLFMNKEALNEARKLLDAMVPDEKSLAGAVIEFFLIYEDILELEKAPKDIPHKTISGVMKRCEAVEQILQSYRSGEAKLNGPTLQIVPARKAVPMACFLAEGLSQISLFKLQLKALQSGLSMSSTASQVFNLSKPTEISTDTEIGARENILRWLM